ncbi:TraX family protein [Metapseudomonas otitidis]|uniref:TraX family protein n=1 Tax=Metapseudomonas otitidis TaxID=319939 RepID=UPI000D19EF47|nr:TraX family protein [Pseudomonas otitidis]
MRNSEVLENGGGGLLPTLSCAQLDVNLLKWVALVLMIGDHINKYVFHESVAVLFYAGRLVMPVFAFVLAANLSRDSAVTSGAINRTARRLFGWGVIACIPYIALGEVIAGWWPLNILLMLFCSTVVISLLAKGGWWSHVEALVVFLLGGAIVEFWWPGIGLCVASWAYFRKPSWVALICSFVSLASLHLINGNSWALASLALIFAAAKIRTPLPRAKHFFYAFYPAHLAAIWLYVPI